MVDQRGQDRKTRKRLEEIVSKHQEKTKRIGDYPCKILLIKKQIFYIHGFIFYPICKKIRFHDDIVRGISTG